MAAEHVRHPFARTPTEQHPEHRNPEHPLTSGGLGSHQKRACEMQTHLMH